MGLLAEAETADPAEAGRDSSASVNSRSTATRISRRSPDARWKLAKCCATRRACPRRYGDCNPRVRVARARVPPACAVLVPSFATCRGRRRSCAKMQLAKARFAAGLRKHRPAVEYEVSARRTVVAARVRGRFTKALDNPICGFFHVMSSPSPIAGDYACESFERGNLRCRKISSFAFAQKGHEVHRCVRPKVSRHDPDSPHSFPRRDRQSGPCERRRKREFRLLAAGLAAIASMIT